MAYDVAKAFKRIEDELIDSMMRNLGRHNAEEALEGFDWTQWQVEQLRSLEEYRKNNQEKYGPEFKKINERIGKSIERMGAKGENEQEKEILRAIDNGHVPPIKREGNLEGAFFGVNNRKLDALLDATQNDFQRAEIAVLRRADDQYRRIIFDAQVYANTGAATYGKAIDMATKDFLMRGIDCIEYKNGARHTISDYADMYVKTAQTRAYLAGEGKMREEWGEHYVIVNKRGDVTCPKCAKWVGRVLIDDVYSGGKSDGKTPLLSEAMAQGFLHPRCKDIFTTYFPGISTPPKPATKKEIRQAERAEKTEARQNTAELMQEKWERRAKYQMDPADKRMCAARAGEWKQNSIAIKDADDYIDKSDLNTRKHTDMAKLKQDRGGKRKGVAVTKIYIQDATPKRGHVDYAPGFQPDNRIDEVRTAHIIHEELGGDILLRAEVHKDKVKNPDYEWLGALWDLKSTSTSKSVNSAIRSGMKQIYENPGGIILNFGDEEIDLVEIKNAIDVRMGWYADGSADIIIISKERVIKVWRY